MEQALGAITHEKTPCWRQVRLARRWVQARARLVRSGVVMARSLATARMRCGTVVTMALCGRVVACGVCSPLGPPGVKLSSRRSSDALKLPSITARWL